MTQRRASVPITPFLDEQVIQRFWAHVERTPGCWLWKGAHNQGGYGFFRIGRSNAVAHRVAWAIYTGQEPVARVLHHCDVPACVRREHLFAGTQADNMRDAAEKGRVISRPFAERRSRRSYAGEGNPHWRGGVGYRWGRKPTTHEQRVEIARRAARARWST